MKELPSSKSPGPDVYTNAYFWKFLHHLYHLTHSSSFQTKMQENSVKLLTWCYWVPSKIVTMYPSMSILCWRGSRHHETLHHIWWECPNIRSFWLDMKAHIKSILDMDIPNSPIHIPTFPFSQYKKCVLPHLLNAFRCLIPIYWNKTQVPSRQH